MQFADAIKKIPLAKPGSLVEAQKKIIELEHTIKQLEFQNIVLQEKYDLLVYKRFVRTSETQNAAQPELFEEAAEGTGKENKEEEAEKKTVTYQRNKRNAGRKPLPENLTREERVNDLSEEEKTCGCGRRLERIGEDVSEKLIIEEPRIYVQGTVTPKYVSARAARVINMTPARPAL
jgi:hypothetical protein